MNDTASNTAVAQYFSTMAAALGGLDIHFGNPDARLADNGPSASVLLPYIDRLRNSFACWQNRIGFSEQFRVSRAESGFPVFQNVLELENDRAGAAKRLATIPAARSLREEMVDFILRQKEFPTALQTQIAERLYLEQIGKGEIFSPLVLPETIGVTVNPASRRPSYLVTWAAFDGTSTLPMVYVATIEDSSENVVKLLVTDEGGLNSDMDIPLPVGGLLNPELARLFDDFVTRNAAYSLTPATIATNMDRDFPTLHPKSVRRIVLGPFYSSGITENAGRVNEILSKVRKPENAWVMTWTVQEVFSKREQPAQKGFFSSAPAVQEFHIETHDLEAARMGVSSYEKHALVPHDAYQALYASGEAKAIFGNFKVHVISGNQIVSEV
ncbi:hypothetical protein [Rhizobium sp. 18065]|uniref:hypothetical protein n=1 Tax=Rhizobium sp. 18065 TaxID=2681411 RepID=UPI0013584175|nr:hypothetical protein [Rhizobium sp. 18065]